MNNCGGPQIKEEVTVLKKISGVFDPLRFSLGYIQKKSKLILVIISFAFVAAVARLLIPIYIGDSVGALESGEIYRIQSFIILILVVSAITAFSQFFINYLSQLVSQSYAFNLRSHLLHKLLLKKVGFMENKTSGDLLSRSTMDIEASRNFILNTTTTLISTMFLIVIGLYLLITLNYIYALFFALSVPFIVYTGMVFQRKQRIHWRNIRSIYGLMNERLQENIVGQRVVRGYQGARSEDKRFNQTTGNYYDEYMEVAHLRGLYNNLMPLSVGVAATAVILYGGFIDIISGASVGSLVAAVNIFIMVSSPISFLGRIIVFSENARASIVRIKEIINDREEESAGNSLSKMKLPGADLIFQGVSFIRGDRRILNRIEVSIKPGEIVSLTGRIGSGKSTLISLIPRLYEPSEGKIEIAGKSIEQYTLSDLRKLVAIVPQSSNLLSGTVFDNIAFGRPFTIDEVRKAAKIAEISEFIEGLAEEYNTAVGERGITLSGGQKQRMLVARAVIGKPGILVLDDATSSVDPQTEMEMLGNIRRELNGTTIIIVSHRPSVARFAERVLLLENGEVVESTLEKAISIDNDKGPKKDGGEDNAEEL